MVLVVTLFFISSCAHYQINQPLSDIHQNESYSFDTFSQPGEADETFVVLTFSGGGTRAAAFSFGVLEGLRETRLPGTDKTLLDEVDLISTVSGGSFTGAYYALFGERIFEDFRERFLYRDIEREIAFRLLNPANLFRVISPYFSRIDLAGRGIPAPSALAQ